MIRERYASDLSDQEYALIQPLLPDAKPLRRKPTDHRVILNAFFHMIRCGCPWRYLPKGLPTLHNRTEPLLCLARQRALGLWDQVVAVSVMAIRKAEGKSAAPMVAIVDSKSVKPPRRADQAATTRARR